MDRAIQAWVDEPTSNVADSLRLLYTVYGCMLLLSPNAFESPAWQDYREENDKLDLERLYELMCHHLKITHIAINKPIPVLREEDSSENIVRSPTNFTPLYGDFGSDSASSPPTSSDFNTAFWVTAKQNGIFQTWAPRWTMFSRGNISEKSRLLSLPSVKEAVDQGKTDGKGSATVDLYAGIGYFAFSYLKAGVEKVLCWDLNPWSAEGLKRGATANKWSMGALSGDGAIQDLVGSQTRLLVFNEPNEHASDRIRSMREDLPPIRHVNCGLLPTSRGSWQTAVEILDRELGGWMHIHENFAVDEIDQKAEEVRFSIQQLAWKGGRTGTVKVGHVNRLKSYAPGVMHCVLDLYIPPCPPFE
jgi:tRNA wybutosine-synthesizing protein 2